MKVPRCCTVPSTRPFSTCTWLPSVLFRWAQAWGSVHRTNFDDIEESWMAKVPPKVKKALQQ